VFRIEHDGIVNALRFVTKNVLAVIIEESATVDWLNHYLVMPLGEPVAVKAGQQLHVGFFYRAGGSIPSLQASIRAGGIEIFSTDLHAVSA
jgi:protein arginine N-methyltransferase 1